MIIETKQLNISEELKRKIEFICKFANVDYTFTNGNIKSVKNTNIAYVKPHILKVKETNYLIFEECVIICNSTIISIFFCISKNFIINNKSYKS